MPEILGIFKLINNTNNVNNNYNNTKYNNKCIGKNLKISLLILLYFKIKILFIIFKFFLTFLFFRHIYCLIFILELNLSVKIIKYHSKQNSKVGVFIFVPT